MEVLLGDRGGCPGRTIGRHENVECSSLPDSWGRYKQPKASPHLVSDARVAHED